MRTPERRRRVQKGLKTKGGGQSQGFIHDRVKEMKKERKNLELPDFLNQGCNKMQIAEGKKNGCDGAWDATSTV